MAVVHWMRYKILLSNEEILGYLHLCNTQNVPDTRPVSGIAYFFKY